MVEQNNPCYSYEETEKIKSIKKTDGKKKVDKKLLCSYCLVVVISLIFASGFVLNGCILHGHGDVGFHLFRIQGAIDALKDGQIIPQVSPNDLYGYGYGSNIFYGPLPVYIIIVLKVFLGNLNNALNLFIIFIFIFSAIFMLKFMNEFSNNNMLSFLASVLYISTPAFMFNAYGKTGIGEMMVFCVVPLLLLGLYRLITNKRYSVFYLVLSVSSIILSHNLSIILFGFLSLVILICNIKNILNKNSLVKLFIVAVFTFLITAFYTFPLIECRMSNLYPIFDNDYVSRYMNMNSDSLNLQRSSLIDIFIIDNSQLTNCCFGIIVIPTLVLTPFTIFKQKNVRARYLLALYIVVVVCVVFTSKLINWEIMPSFLYKIQLLFRFKFLFAPCAAVLLSYSIMSLRDCKSYYKAVAIFVVTSTVLFISVQGVVNINKYNKTTAQGWLAKANDNAYECESLGCGCEYLTLAQNSAYSYDNMNEFVENEYHSGKKDVRIVNGSAKTDWNSQGSNFEIIVQSENNQDCTIEVPKLYYPGYKTEVQGCKCSITCGEKGLVNLCLSNIEKDTIKVHLYYGLSNFTLVGLILSIVGTLSFIVYLLYGRKRKISYI